VSRGTTPSARQIEAARLLLVANATELKSEAELLLAHGHHARAYLLAHLASEELAKIVLLARAAKAVRDAEPMQWAKVQKVMREHTDKLAILIFADHADSIDVGEDDEDTQLDVKLRRVAEFNRKKNASMYVDLASGLFSTPKDEITEADAKTMLDALTSRWLWAYAREVLFFDKMQHKVLESPDFKKFWRQTMA
jgi:AbiV family abortive infection protein